MAEQYFPIDSATMIQLEYSQGITGDLEYHPCSNLEVEKEGPCSISTSINFETPQHVDIRDDSVIIFSWYLIGSPVTDGYFVLNNLQVTFGEQVYNELAIKLVDGLLVSADGHFIRHRMTSSEF